MTRNERERCVLGFVQPYCLTKTTCKLGGKLFTEKMVLERIYSEKERSNVSFVNVFAICFGLQLTMCHLWRITFETAINRRVFLGAPWLTNRGLFYTLSHIQNTRATLVRSSRAFETPFVLRSKINDHRVEETCFQRFARFHKVSISPRGRRIGAFASLNLQNDAKRTIERRRFASITFDRLSKRSITAMDLERNSAFKEYQKILDNLKDEFLQTWKLPKSDTVTLEDFELFRTIGTGAFGRVLLVKYKPTSAYYAMKIMDKAKIVKKKQVDHTYNEKRVLQCVKFPFLVYMEFCFKDNSYIYMVLPFVNGGEMFTHLRRMGRFDESLARFYAAQVVLALEYLHHCSLVYRDLKPENILIQDTGYIRVTDFGFCKMINSRTWTLCGTPEYLAPEVILSKGYGRSVDWWSFGVLVYEMNAGYPPFYSRDTMKIYEKIIVGKYKFAHHFGEELRDILKNILQVDLTRRYGNLKNGTMDIKEHRWFETTDWNMIYHQKVQPSFIPTCQSPEDTSNFDHYRETPLKITNFDNFPEEFANF
ncbi:cAMP-dependent protein kinase catalytic subunit [Ptiloglossa arizonensis]|uniref:cAMP-dependent protein kinase catalytic subunit n=1 Tax=Ptiloglossa arizonensis TaxID=3350558 RepID=UPI003F9FC2B4